MYRRDQNQIAGLAREYDYMGRSLMFFWSHVDVMENSKMLPSNRITHFSGPDHQPLPLAMPWYSSSSSYAPMAAAASGLVVVVVLVEEALVEEMPVSKLSLFWRTKNTLDTSTGAITPVSSTQLVHTSSNSCQGRFVINFQGKKVYTTSTSRIQRLLSIDPRVR